MVRNRQSEHTLKSAEMRLEEGFLLIQGDNGHHHGMNLGLDVMMDL